MPTEPSSVCQSNRILISAAADDTISTDEQVVLSAHLDSCAACASYAEAVSSLSRQVRVRPVPYNGAFVAKVMERSQPVRLGRGGWMRPALAWCALVVAVQSVQPLFFGDASGASVHTARHIGATSLALAIGFAFVAVQPRRAAGLLPFVAALAGTTTLATLVDLVAGSAATVGELAHLSEVVGMVLLWMIAGFPGIDRLSSRRLRQVRLNN